MKIIFYPHPTLRYKSKPVKRVDDGLKKIVAEMFELMYAARGIGLAANQVGLPLQLFVINASGERGAGEELVFINPIITQPRGSDAAEEGCLSIPGVNGQVARPARIQVAAYDLSGNQLDFEASGLLARAIQHECDHLNGVLFIDRVSDSEKKLIEEELDEFVLDFNAQRAAAIIGNDASIQEFHREIESKYC